MQNRDQLLARAEAYLKGLFAEASGLPVAEFDPATPFGELGVDSFRVLKILKALEADFGSLPKTLLFENFNLEALAGYFVDRHAEALQKRLSSGSTATPTVGRVGAPAKSVPPSAPTPTPRAPAPLPTESVVVQIEPLMLLEADLPAHPQLQAHIEGLYARYKNEGCVSRGTRDIAPNLFIGSRRHGYFNYARSRTLILVYAYTGPRDYFAELAAELQAHCQRHGLQLNVFADEAIEVIGDTAFSSTPFGALQRVCEIRDFSLQGSAMRRLRYLLAKFEKAGPCRTVEYQCGSQPQVDQEIGTVIDAWCASKPMVNPLIARVRAEILRGRLHPQHRLFLTYQNDRLQNVILISRLCDELNGYLMDLEFYGQDMPLGGLDYAIVRIIEALAAEGCDLLSLGGTYGCRLERSPLADPEVDRVLDDLHRQGIFNDAGNLQFKNKFRPQNRSIYLCRPREAGSADSVLDLIMMIADPERTQTSDAEHHNPPGTAATSPALPVAQAAQGEFARTTASASQGSAALDGEAQSRLAALADAGFNPLHLVDAAVEFEHKTDSWAQLRHRPEVAQSMQALRADLQMPIDLQSALRELIPFRHIALTESGRSADELFCKAWARPGLVPQNLLFPTCLFHQIDKGFSPQELPHPSLFAVDTPSAQKAELDLDALKALLATRAAEVAYVCVELSDNASGGQAVSLRHLRELRALLDSHGLSLVIDATRVLENAHLLVQHDPEHVNDRPWALAHELLAQAHVLIGSLAKDFGLDRGGLIASDDETLLGRVQALMSQDGGGLTVLDKKLVGLAFSRRNLIEQRVSRRLRQVEQVWHCLDSLGLPLLQAAGAHCVLIDVKRLPDFNALEHPVAAFLAWLYLHTGVRAGAHSVGMQKNTPINDLVRLAIPQGLDDAQVQILCERLRAAFAQTAYIPELSQTGESAAGMGELSARYALLGFRNAPAASSENSINGGLAVSGDHVRSSASAAAPLRPAASTGPGAGAKVTTQSRREDQGLDIAVIGMAGRYPQADDLHAFWQNLRAGRDCISELPAQRRAQRAGGACNRDYRGGFLDAIDRFDSLFFNISPREAEMLDPQERMFLEVAWETLEDAGYYPELLAQEGRRDVGVFVGAVWALYQILGVEAKLAGGEQHPNSFLWSIANRVSYWMNFTGPSLTVDTACSSSLTAIYLACEAIRRGDCSSALVGGVNLDLHQHKFDINHAGGALSADGVCRSFGEGANGYVAGEGVGAILLKPLAQAVADHDQIYGVIRGAASNHGGRTSGYTVPNPKAQAELIGIALRRAGVDARSIGYIEAHGTGTELGDPIEIAGLSQAFARDGVAAGQCPIGSVKTNIGHLEAGAGLVGLSKVLLQMRERELVPSLHAERLNPHIEFEHSPFHVQRELQPWRPLLLDGIEQPLRAGVSSFGAGGANAHVVVEECPVPLGNEVVPDEGYLFPLSARNEEQLKQMAQRLHQRLSERTYRPRLCDLAYTLQNGRKSFEHRAAIIAADYPALLAGLEALATGRSHPDLHCGHARAADGLTRLLDREERERFIELLMQGRDPHKLARLWIDGLLSDCRGLVQGDARRVSLPTYPFADKRHWIATAAATAPRMHSIAAGPALHPLIDTNESTFSRQLFRKRFHASEFFLREHVVSGLPTLPGTAYLDLARRAGELATGLPVRRIRNITWVSPLSAAAGGVVDVLTELKPVAEAVQFEVFSERADGSRQLYAQGKLEFAAEPAAAEFIDLAAIQARCTRLLGGEEAYPLFAQFGLDYGPSFRLLREVHRSADEVLGLLQLPTVREADFDAFALHPSVIDAAMQAGVVGQLGQPEGQMKVPYSITEVELLHPLSRTCYSHVTRTPGTRESSSGVSRENVCIVDENGRVLVRLRESIGVPLTSVHEKPAPRALGSKGGDNQSLGESGFDELYYRPQWLARALPELPSERGDVLLFDRDPRRAEALRAFGLRVHCVLPGDAFEDLGNDSFRVQPRHKQDYARLLAELRSRAALPTRICIGWGSTEAAADAEALQAALDYGVYALLSLSQALIECKLESRLQLLYLHSRAPSEVELPEHAGLDGFLRSLRLENPRIDAKRLQLDSNDVTLAARTLLQELHSAAQLDLSVRYRAGLREVRSLVRLTDGELPATEASALPLRQRGVYLITGGAGGLGLIFAEFLARQCQATLVLSGRSPLSSERSDDLQGLRDLGAEVEYLQADVSEPSAARALIDHCQQAHGGLHGILHSAGVLRDSFLRNKTQEDMAAVLAPKVLGGFHLDRCSAALPLDFFVCFSSLAAIGGNAGQCDYAYANCYMDALMAQREQLSASGRRSGRSLSLNWSLWADGGMRLDEQTELFFRKTLGIRPLRREIGEQALLRALRAEPSQIAVLEAVPEKIEQAWGLAAPVVQPVQQASAPAAVVDKAAASSAGLHDAVIAELSGLVMEMLKLGADELSLDNILLDLGFDSIGLTTFANAINERYLLDINPVLFFEYPSLRAITGHLLEEHAAAMAAAHAGAAGSRVDSSTTASDLTTSGLTTSAPTTPAAVSAEANTVSPMFGRKQWQGPSHSSNSNAAGTTATPTNRFRDMPIAIVGMAGVMPQSDTLEEFWDHLAHARNLVTEIPRDRWIWEQYDGNPVKEVNKSNSRWGGFMREVDKFDPLFFGITPREAEMMDPQQRIFIETVWAAIEDSGQKVSDLSGTRTGLFVGTSAKDYIDVLATHQSSLDGFSASGNSHSILANRVSFLLNLRGPSAPLDTACSSSLVALHRAIESIHTGSSDMAIVGGVQVMLTPIAHISLSSAGMLSIDGKCKTFDKDANGYVRGEGVGAIFIKPLHQAEADGNPIHAVIRATAENHGGRVTMLTAPNPKAQAELLFEAYDKAGIDPSTVGYIECHGTGTSLGDPIEIQALKKSFGDLYRAYGCNAPTQAHCGLSSVKTNIGHLEPAAGIASLLKVLLAIRYQQIPALLHFQTLNPYIDLEGSPFYVADKTVPWAAPRASSGEELPRCAGVSSFGWGGANAHVVLQQYRPLTPATPSSAGPCLVPLSARSSERLRAYAQRLADFLQANPDTDLQALAYTLQVGRDPMDERLGVVAHSHAELLHRLQAYAAGQEQIEGLARGRVQRFRKNEQGLSSLEQTPAPAVSEAELKAQFAAGDFNRIAQLWVAGHELDWTALRQGRPPQRLSLPGYPFARERHWIEPKPGVQEDRGGTPLLHPLLHQNTSTLDSHRYTSQFAGGEFFLVDHAGALPAAAMVGMAVQAGRRALALPASAPVELQDLNWLPAADTSISSSIELRLHRDGRSGTLFELLAATKASPGERHLLCRGSAKPSTIGLPSALDLPRIAALLRGGDLTETELQSHVDALAPRRGPLMRGIQSLQRGYRQVLLRLQLPTSLHSGADAFDLHPTLLDAVFQGAGLLHGVPTASLLAAPAHIARLQIFAPVPAQAWAWGRYSRDSSETSASPCFDLDITDSEGRICLSARQLCLQPTQLKQDAGLDADFSRLVEAAYSPDVPNRVIASAAGDEFAQILETLLQE